MAEMNLGDVDAAARRLAAGIEGSEDLQLPVLRAQLRWMEAVLAGWRGDFAEAERHHGIAAHVHEQTELYEAGSGLLAAVSLLRESGGPVDPAWPSVGAPAETGGHGIVGLVETALMTLSGNGSRSDEAAVAVLQAWVSNRGRPHVWTSLGHAVLLAHLTADRGLARFCAPLLEELEPFGDRIAVIGQVGAVGPVALATARLRALAGDRDAARDDLERAVGIAKRTGGAPTLVRCALLSAELTEDRAARRAAAAEVAAEARRLGMAGMAQAADELA
jgi:hypothetical protein